MSIISNILHSIATGISIILISAAGFFSPVTPAITPEDQAAKDQLINLEIQINALKETLKDLNRVGATYDIPTTIALFETSLANSITTSATTMTLVSATDKDGNTLASSTYGFIIDEGTASEEFVLADCTGTACTNMTRGISALTGTTTVTALRKAHRRGASVKITSAPQLLILSRIMNGVGTFPNIISYKTHPTFTADTQLIDKLYADGLTYGANPDMTPTIKGFGEQATGAEAAAGTTVGDTSAPLVLTTAISTSTSQVAQNSIVVTNSSGKIDNSFLNGQNYILGNATTTNATTTSLQVSSLASTTDLIVSGNTTFKNATGTNLQISGTASTTNLIVSGTITGGHMDYLSSSASCAGSSGSWNVTAPTNANYAIIDWAISDAIGLGNGTSFAFKTATTSFGFNGISCAGGTANCDGVYSVRLNETLGQLVFEETADEGSDSSLATCVAYFFR